MNNLVFVENIKINEKNVLSIKPQNVCFAMIYRSAMGVHWDNENTCLYFISPVEQASDILNAYMQIILAVKEEYGKILNLHIDTIYENISKNIRAKIMSWTQEWTQSDGVKCYK